MTPLHDDWPQCAQTREEAMLTEEAKARAELRDRFAIAALTGMLAYPDNGLCPDQPIDFSRRAYEYADAMLKARGE